MNTTPTVIAELLKGRPYRGEVTKAEEAELKAAGFVVVFGASDDLMEFRGAIHDEVSCYEGATAYLTSAGLLENDCSNEECPHFTKLKEAATTIEALWCKEDVLSWTYKTDIPHLTFEVTEDDVTYCRGIIFNLSAVK